MKILYFSREYSTHDHRFLLALAKTEHRVYYLRLEQGAHALEERPVPSGIETVEWAGGRKRVSFIDGPALLASLKKVIRNIQPDLVQAGPLQRSALLAALCGINRQSRPRLISMSWGYDLIFDARRNFLWDRATRYTLQRSAVMIGDCETVRRLAVSYGMPDERIVTFPWGIDIDFFQPPPAGAPSVVEDQQTFTLLSTRSWEPLYGVDVIARAFVIAARQKPRLRLVMAGNGSQAALLHRIFADGGVIERVSFPGQVNQAGLRELFQQAGAYVSASHSDGTSISLLEALACARPVLVSDIPGNREWVQPGVQGYLFPDGGAGTGDAQALAELMLTLSGQPDSGMALGAAGRKLAEQRADWSKNFQHMLFAYELAMRDAVFPSLQGRGQGERSSVP